MPAEPILDPELAAFVSSGVSIHVASCNAERVPSQTRAAGARVSTDRRRVTVFVYASQSGALLGDLRAGGAVAAVFSQPSTHRTVQLKGPGAHVEPLGREDGALVARHREAFVRELTALGYAEVLPRTLLSGARDDLVALAFTPTAAFVQTPGPGAGTAIRRA